MNRGCWIKPPGPVTPGLRVGLLGGSFNPAHAGHLHVSEVALKRLRLDYVWWLVSPQNPLKPVAGMAPFAGHPPMGNAGRPETAPQAFEIAQKAAEDGGRPQLLKAAP